jgi:hypothetical protein
VELQTEWNEFLSVLKRHGVRFLLVGAHAVAAHGRPRFTQNLDVLVEPTLANAHRVAAAIREFGFSETARDWHWFAKPYRITMIGRLPNRIDVLTSISGVSFREAWKHRVELASEIGPIPALGLEELRANKRAAGRPKDMADLALLDELTLATSKARVDQRARPAKRSRKRAGPAATVKLPESVDSRRRVNGMRPAPTQAGVWRPRPARPDA